MTAWLMAAAVLVILVLAGIAGYLHWKLFQHHIKRDKLRAAQEIELRKKRENNLNSICILLRAMLEDQVTLTESCIRCCVLMESLLLSREEKASYASFYKLAEATAHIPILDEWKLLPTKRKLEFDREREEFEQQYRDFVLDGARTFLEREPQYQNHIASL